MVTRRQLGELRRLLGDPQECPECAEAFVIGMPDLFGVGYRPRKEGDPVGQEGGRHGGSASRENTLVKTSAEELAEPGWRSPYLFLTHRSVSRPSMVSPAG